MLLNKKGDVNFCRNFFYLCENTNFAINRLYQLYRLFFYCSLECKVTMQKLNIIILNTKQIVIVELNRVHYNWS